MKKTFIIFMLMLLSATSFAQRKAYIDVWAQPWPLTVSKYLLCADFGRTSVESICDENNPSVGKQFASPIAGINFLASLGWRVVSTYQDTDLITKKPALHYLLEKDINDDADILKGITTKQEKAKEKKQFKMGKAGDDMY